MKFHISSMLQIWPHAPHAVRIEIWILSYFVDFQVIEALTAEPPVAWCQASGGFRWRQVCQSD